MSMVRNQEVHHEGSSLPAPRRGCEPVDAASSCHESTTQCSRSSCLQKRRLKSWAKRASVSGMSSLGRSPGRSQFVVLQSVDATGLPATIPAGARHCGAAAPACGFPRTT